MIVRQPRSVCSLNCQFVLAICIVDTFTQLQTRHSLLTLYSGKSHSDVKGKYFGQSSAVFVGGWIGFQGRVFNSHLIIES